MVKTKPTVLLNEAFPDWADGKGIFSEFTVTPWVDIIDADLLDIDYFGNHSGMKKCAPLLYALMTDEHTISDEDRAKIAALVEARFLPNWEALWRTYHLTYNPITDYSMTETGSNNEQSSGTSSGSKSGTNTGTDNTSIVHGEIIAKTEQSSGSENNSRHGFNSLEAVPTESRTMQGSITDSETHSGTDQNNRTLNLANSETESETESGSKSGSYTKNRTGLTGAHYIQELIQKERELWIEDYFERIFSDIDSVVASMIYNREHHVNPYSMFPFGYYHI